MVNAKKLMMLMVILLLSSFRVMAQDRYVLVGAVSVQKAGEFHKLPLPTDPAESGTLENAGDSFVFHYADDSCAVKVVEKRTFDFDTVLAHTFGTPEAMDKFIFGKFHLAYKDIGQTYRLGNSNSPTCAALRYSRMYASNDSLILLDGSWIYVFERQTSPGRSAKEGFDCTSARTKVELLICGNRDLLTLDAQVNRGFVAMQTIYSREISYQDPVRNNQLDWLTNFRNKCATESCLFEAYTSRIKYIKSRISSGYPSYPSREPDQDSD